MSIFNAIFLTFFVISVTVIHDSIAQNNRRGSQSCQTPNGQTGNCVILQSCPDLAALFRRRPIPNDAKDLLRRSSCGFEGNVPKVCCSAGVTNRGTMPDDGPVPPNPLIPTRDECGDSLVNKIVNGEDTDITDFPWMALLEYTKPTGKAFHCGGVLVSARYVLTAAHCVNGPAINENIRLTGIRLGEWDTSTPQDCLLGTCSAAPLNIPVESTVVHENYGRNSQSQPNDIALVRLARPVTYTQWIKPICLPLISQITSRANYVGEDMTVAGWGRTTNTRGSEATKLQKVRVPVVDASSCNSRYQNLRVTVSGSQMCAGGSSGKDSCLGDSGGPLMIQQDEGSNSNWFVAGIVSFGPTVCGSPGWPGIYTDVSKYGAWISRNIRP